MTENAPQTLEAELTAILDALEIVAPDAFRFAGGPVHHLPQPGAMAGALLGTLYTNCYAHRFPGPPPRSPYAPDPLHPHKLDAANGNRDHWDGGWRVYAADPDGTLSVVKGECQRRVRAGEYLSTNGRGSVPQPGEQVLLWLTRGSHTIQTAFQFMYGEAPTDMWDEFALTRVYFNITPTGVIPLVRAITAALNAYQVPYRMKALTDATHYTRSDSMVLYMARRHAEFVARIIAGLDREATAGLADPTPLFTCRFLPGVGFAEDPGNGDSFGLHRCRLIADAVLAAHAAGQTATAQKLAAVKARFATAGISLDHPWVSPGRTDIYSAFDAERLAP